MPVILPQFFSNFIKGNSKLFLSLSDIIGANEKIPQKQKPAEKN